MSHDSLVTKPASGHWTDAHPELGRGPVSLEDCVSEEFYEKERAHVFTRRLGSTSGGPSEYRSRAATSPAS